jgi:DNA-binding LytR/AlgR family response regulator
MKESRQHAAIVKFFLILIPLINVFNYYLTYNNIALNWRTLLTFTLDTLEGYAAWAAVHFIIVYLDKRLPFTENVIKRLIIQIVTTLFTGMLIIIGLTVIIHYSTSREPIPRSFFTYDVFIISVWFLVINGIYIAMHFYREWRTAEYKRMEENKIKIGGIKVRSGKQEFLLNYDEVAGFMVDGEYILCFTMASKKFLLDQSMDKLEKLLPGSWFFRLNRQFLLHRQIISGFEKAENGKLNILIKFTPIASPIKVSRTRASTFKNWFQPG